MSTLHTRTQVHANLYKDSVALMRVAQALLGTDGVVNATLQMGTEANKAILQEAGLLLADVSHAGPADVMVVVQALTAAVADAAMHSAEQQLAGKSSAGAGQTSQQAMVPRSMGQWLKTAANPHFNVVQISVPGAYAAAEGLKAVHQGLNVFMFSDNVPLAQEVAMKQAAKTKGVLVMGPDCGTAIIGGVPLGFANAVRRGSIGIVAASGTGLQEVSTQIHRMGAGVSHAIGTGGRDVYADVGGITMLQGIELLTNDADTHVIAIVSKPPAPEVTTKVFAALQAAGKPAVVVFLGSDMASPSPNIHVTHTLVDCAAQAVRLAQTTRWRADATTTYPLSAKPRFAPSQKYLRALYSGGTYCSEAQVLWARAGLNVWSNIPVNKAFALDNPKKASFEHTALDLGDDDFTVGKPHPMIDQSARIERLRKEAADPAVRVIVLDVVIGWGAHANPASELVQAIAQAKQTAKQAGRQLAVVGFVCGTDADPQGLTEQEQQLRKAGMVLAPNSSSAAWLAQAWLK